jgi:signal transduction histidine kinase
MAVIESTPPGAASPLALPAGSTSPLSAEQIALESLVHHRGAVADDTPLEEVHTFFRERNVDFLAVMRDQCVLGLCSKAHLGFLLGSRFGFALYSKAPVREALVARPIILRPNMPIREVLQRALARRGHEFYEDVALVDGQSALGGLIPVEALARLQTRLVAEQVDELRRQNLEMSRANRALRRAQGLYQGLFESDALGVALLDRHGQIQSHNRRLAELLGLEEGGEAPTLASWISDHDRPAFLHMLTTHENQGPASTTGEYLVNLPSQGIRLFRFYTGWISETGQICACIDDITKQREIERHMHRQEKQRLLDTLVGGIAHELNNKLTPVLGFADLLASGRQVPQYAGYISKSADEAAHIIRQLLQLSKPETGNRHAIDLREVIQESLVMLKFKLRESRAEVRTVLADHRIEAFADGSQIKQVIINLVLNALHAMEGRAGSVLEIAAGVRVNETFVRVADNGEGIPPEILGRIFDPFFTTKGPDRGSGLGLSVCSGIIAQHGGEISVESEPGRGAAFTVCLPLPLDQELAARGPAAGADAEAAPAVRTGRGRRILVVEDEEAVGMLLREVLGSGFDCGVDVAADGIEALRQIGQREYSLVVSDVRMPRMGGPELLLRLRADRPALACRLVFVSGHLGDKALEEQIARWNVPLVAKPFTPGRLMAACGPFFRDLPGPPPVQ